MRTAGVFVAVLSIALLGMAATASAQCTAVLADGLFPTGGQVQIGDTIEYMMTASVPNVPDYCTLYDVDLYFFPPPGEPDPCDNLGGGVLIAENLTLTPGGPVHIFTSADHPALAHVVTLADMTDADGYLIIADMATSFYIEGGTGAPQCDESSSVVYGTNPCIEVTKDACGFSKVGDEVVYTVCVTNCSNPPAPLYNVVVSDPLLGGTLAGFPDELAPGQEVCVDFPYIVQSGDADPLENTVSAQGEDAYGNVVFDSDLAIVDLLHPDFEVEMECLTVPVPAGGYADYQITITNLGDVDLMIDTDEASIAPFRLYVSDSFQTQVSVQDPGGVDCVFNSINVTATIPSEFCDLPNVLTDYAEACCPVSSPCIEVTKEVECDISKVGDEVIYTICVTNCSNPPAPLYNVVVSDPMLENGARGSSKKLRDGTLDRPVVGLAGFPSTLAPGESVCVDFPYTIQPGDPDPLENTVSADAESEYGVAAPTVYATEVVDLIHPSFTVEMDCDTTPVTPGGDADFTVTLHNTGDVPLLITTDELAVPPFTLGVGEQPTFTVTVADPGGVDCVLGDINVTATIPPDYCNLPNVLTGFADACCPIDGPAIEITKDVDCDISSEGDEVIYTICVTNTSNPPATLYNVVVSDPLLGGTLGGFPSELTPGQSVCVDFPYTIQAGDPDPLENRVDVDAESQYGTAVSDYAEETVDLIHPSFTVTKECMTDPVPAGGDADFLITITNTGDFDLWIETDEAGIPGFALMVADPVFTQTVTVTDPGGVDCVFNAINVTATLYPDECEIGTELTGYAEACCTIDGPAIEITKDVDCDISSEGDEVIYTICVTNMSNPPATLYNVVVSDPLLGGTLGGFPSELTPGQSVCVDFPYTIQSGDPDPLENRVDVDAESQYGTAVSDYAEETVDLIHPSFTVTKECMTDPVPAGGDADFLITITNTGDFDLWIETDEAGIPGFALMVADPVFTQTVTVTDPGGVDCVFNAINVTATLYPDECEIGTELTGYAEACCTIDGPAIEITKDVDCDISSEGDEVIYTICVTNMSNPPATLYNVVVSDPLLGGTLGGFPSELTPGQSVCVDFPYTIQSGDPDPLENRVDVDAESQYGTAVSDYAEETVDLIHPSFTVTKECMTDPVPAGGDADFLITITNTGDFDLWIETDEAGIPGFALMVADPVFTQTVTVTDPGGVDCVFNAINVTATLYPDECEIGTELTGYAEACCTIDGPAIEITKDVDCDISSEGDEVIYTICVTNTSNPPATLYNVVVSDPLLGGTLGGFPSELTPGQSVCVDFPYTIQSGDPDPLENRVDVDAESQYGTAVSDYAEETVDLIHPSFTVTKECMTDPVPAGGDADFLITITNTGDFDLWIETDEAGIPGFALMVADPVFTQTVTVTDPGGVDCVFNAINVTATLYPDECEIGTELTGYAEACCTIDGPAIEITKDVDCDISSEGDEVIYTICVTNMSNPPATLYNVVVSDPLLGGTLGGFPSELTPGQSVCVDFPYTIQSGDPDPLENRVDVNAESQYGTAVSDYAEETVDLIHPSFEVMKECMTPEVPAGGDADFLITITNTGDFDLWIETDEAGIPGFALMVADPVFTQTVTVTDPGGVECIFNAINVTATLYPDECEIGTELTGYAEACCEVQAGTEGCTPGYWKNHTDCWECYTPDTPLGDVFTFPSELSSFESKTLHQAMQFGGGDGLEGTVRNMLRHASAALQNACDADVEYPMGLTGVIDAVNTALATLDVSAIHAVHMTFEMYNEYGCPQDAHCRPSDGDDRSSGRGPADASGDGVDLEPEDRGLSTTAAFSQAVPNPFRDNVRIHFSIPQSGLVAIDVFDVTGRHVTSLMDEDKAAGAYEVAWNGRSSANTPMPAGVYFYRVRLENEILMKKMIMID